MQTLFDGYLIVDWSASSVPRQGKDSIWWCHLQWDEGTLIANDDNPATRQLAIKQIRDILYSYASSEKRLLVGFDFAYAYPRGFASELATSANACWQSVWQHLSRLIEDDNNNQNNRFIVAAGLNKALTGKASPFWGCPKGQRSQHLSMYKPRQDRFPEYRIVEQGTGAHSVWKLAYPGAVGSQVLTGLPYLYELRNDPGLQAFSRVWPFETGLRELKLCDLSEWRIIHAEVYPSLVTIAPKANEIKDQLQVYALAQYFAEFDYRGKLGPLFAGMHPINDTERDIVEQEEGWILGA